MSLKLVQELSGKFQPEKYHDEYSEELRDIIERKIKGIGIQHRKKIPVKSSKIHDISALLKASLKEVHRPKKQPTQRHRKRA